MRRKNKQRAIYKQIVQLFFCLMAVIGVTTTLLLSVVVFYMYMNNGVFDEYVEEVTQYIQWKEQQDKRIGEQGKNE